MILTLPAFRNNKQWIPNLVRNKIWPWMASPISLLAVAGPVAAGLVEEAVVPAVVVAAE